MDVERYNFVIVGTGCVGKTATCIQYVQGTFADGYDPTIFDTYLKPTVIDGVPTRITIVDTCGQDEFAVHRAPYLRNADGVVLCFSLVDRDSFNAIPLCVDQLVQIKGSEVKTPFLLFANKEDLISEHDAVDFEECRAMAAATAKRLGWTSSAEQCFFLSGTAKSYKSVALLWETLVRMVRKIRNPQRNEQSVLNRVERKQEPVLQLTTPQNRPEVPVANSVSRKQWKLPCTML